MRSQMITLVADVVAVVPLAGVGKSVFFLATDMIFTDMIVESFPCLEAPAAVLPVAMQFGIAMGLLLLHACKIDQSSLCNGL